MMKIAIAAVALVALAGCSTVDKIDSAIQRSLPQICSGASILHTSFVALADTGAVSAKLVTREAQAWSVLEPLCTNPGSATSTSVLVAAGNAYVVIASAVRDARKEV